jgi:hypothetical protein
VLQLLCRRCVVVDKVKHSVRVTVIVDIEELGMLTAAADADERSLSGWCRRAMLAAVREQAATNIDIRAAVEKHDARIAEREQK